MATTTVTLTGNAYDAIAGPFDSRRTKAYVRYNATYIADPDAEAFRVGGATVDVAADGAFAIPNVVASVDTVENLQATVVVDYVDPSKRGQNQKHEYVTLGPYDLTGESGTVALTTLEQVQALDASRASVLMAEIEDAKQYVEDVSNIDTPDSLVKTLINDGASQTAGALAASFINSVTVTGPGIDPTGATDSLAAVQALVNAAPAGSLIYFPKSAVIGLSGRLTIPHNCDVWLGSELKPLATVTGALLQWGPANGTLAAGTRVRDRVFWGTGTINCANLAQDGFWLPNYLNVGVSDITVLNPARHHFIFGNATGEGGNELLAQRVKCERSQTGAVPAGSYGIWFQSTARDSVAADCVMVGAETSFRMDGEGNRIRGAHGWGWENHLPSIVFDDNGYNNEWTECVADTPSVCGFRMRGFAWKIRGGVVFNGPFGSDNVVVGIQTDQGGPTGTIADVSFIGIPAHRLATDLAGTTMPNAYLSATGCIQQNVVSPVISNGDFQRSLEVVGPLRIAGSRVHATQVNVDLGGAAPGVTRALVFNIDDAAMPTYYPGRPYTVRVWARNAEADAPRAVADAEMLVYREGSGALISLDAVTNIKQASFGSGLATNSFGVLPSISSDGLTLTIQIKNNGTNVMQFGARLRDY